MYIVHSQSMAFESRIEARRIKATPSGFIYGMLGTLTAFLGMTWVL